MVSFVGVFTLHPPITVIVTAFPFEYTALQNQLDRRN